MMAEGRQKSAPILEVSSPRCIVLQFQPKPVELAKETSRATEEVTAKIDAIQGDTKVAMNAISQVRQVIGRINDLSGTIASAVEEQTATANEMTRSVNEAAQGTNEITNNISSVAEAARETSVGAESCQRSLAILADMAQELLALS